MPNVRLETAYLKRSSKPVRLQGRSCGICLKIKVLSLKLRQHKNEYRHLRNRGQYNFPARFPQWKESGRLRWFTERPPRASGAAAAVVFCAAWAAGNDLRRAGGRIPAAAPATAMGRLRPGRRAARRNKRQRPRAARLAPHRHDAAPSAVLAGHDARALPLVRSLAHSAAHSLARLPTRPPACMPFHPLFSPLGHPRARHRWASSLPPVKKRDSGGVHRTVRLMTQDKDDVHQGVSRLPERSARPRNHHHRHQRRRHRQPGLEEEHASTPRALADADAVNM
ncbi:Protein of unknown function [Gryllus bimaculatus]|nr:Protein of unknown function [Gryllus bimaculatus]